MCDHVECLYQTAELEQSRRTSSVVVESGRVSMGTGAPLPSQVLVVVNGMETLAAVNFRGLSVTLLSRFSTGQRFDEVHLVLETYKPPAERSKNFKGDSMSNSQTDDYLCLRLPVHITDTNMRTKAGFNMRTEVCMTWLQVCRAA